MRAESNEGTSGPVAKLQHVTRRELLPMALVLSSTVFDAAGVPTLSFYLLLCAIPAIVVAGLVALEELVGDDVLPYRRAIARLHVVTLLLVLVAAAVRAPLRAEGAVPRAAISAVVACLVVFAIQGLLASMPALKRIYLARQTPAPSEVAAP